MISLELLHGGRCGQLAELSKPLGINFRIYPSACGQPVGNAKRYPSGCPPSGKGGTIPHDGFPLATFWYNLNLKRKV